jgi:predicted metal-dependent peptidase
LIKDAIQVKIKYTIICPCIQGDPSKKGTGQGDDDKTKTGDPNDAHDHQDGKGEGDKQDSEWSKELDEAWKQAVIVSEQMARMRGNVPGWLTSLVQEIVEPHVPLDKILLQYVGTIVSDETTWRYPNRRFIQRNLYLPSRLANKRDGIVIIDTSGSITDEDANDFLGIVLKVTRSKGINEIRLIQNDTLITDDTRIKNASQFKSHIRETGVRGRGGTSFVAVFETLEKEKIWNAAFILVLTDLEAEFPNKTPRCPTIWVSIKEQKAPFGTTIFWDRKTRKIKVIRK